jgi:hypothetical protein
MSKFGEPQACRNNCGAYIYFDKDSEIGHPSADRWIPLVYEHDTGLRTNTAHQCPNSSFNKGQTQQTQQTQSKSTTIVTQQTKEDRILNLLGDLTIKMNHVIKILEGSK